MIFIKIYICALCSREKRDDIIFRFDTIHLFSFAWHDFISIYYLSTKHDLSSVPYFPVLKQYKFNVIVILQLVCIFLNKYLIEMRSIALAGCSSVCTKYWKCVYTRKYAKDVHIADTY